MAEYCNIRAPQWIDFTQSCSPMQVQDFFEKEHTTHERIEEPCNSAAETMENTQSITIVDISCINPQAQADLGIIKSTPVKVISPKYHKETVVAEATYDQVFNDAMRKLELCLKLEDTLNKSTQEPKIFKTPNMPKLTKSSRFVGSILNKNNQSNQDFTKVNKTNSYMKKLSFKQSLFGQDKNSAENNTFKKSNNSDNTENENKQCNKEDNEECEEENNKEGKEEDSKECEKGDSKKGKESNEKQNEEDKKLQDGQIECIDDIENKKAGNSQEDINEKNNRTQSKHVAVLTWQNHRRNMHKRRTSVNKQYVGLAEAVWRFQTKTPKRFRTKSNKDNTISPSFLTSKLTNNRLNRIKPTIPISPALTTKTRVRPITVLSQEEREMLEVEKMKKHRIKANPIPSNVLRGPRATTKVNNLTRKSIATTNTSSSIQQNEKAKNLSQSKNPHRDKMPSGLKNIPNVIVSNSEGIIVEHEAMAFFGVPKTPTKNVTRVVPFSFEARNKDIQMRKEQRLKNLQEASKAKAEFHARPAPNFSKPSIKQQQNAKKVVPCPFSFEERNKKLSEKKEQLVKQVLEEDKRRVFRANPAPVFKPVMIRGRSKEHISVINKTMKIESEHNAEYNCENQENKEPNEIDSYKTEDENTQRAAKSSACNDDKLLPLKALPLELNTDKRAMKRREFDEKLKHKEIEEEIKRQEQEKNRLEHEKHLRAELRKLGEFKARPMPKYKPLPIIKSTKFLTNPQSPAFMKLTPKRLKT